MDMNLGKTAGSLVSIAGMGIGLGMIAHTAKNITKISDEMNTSNRGSHRLQKRIDNNRKPTLSIQKSQRKPRMYRDYWSGGF